MDNDLKALFGSWDQALGTIISAIGSTPDIRLNQTMKENLSLLGNIMQATGNALVADTQKGFSFNKLGNQIQSIGNSTVIVGLLLQFNDDIEQELNIKGNLLQALGSSVSLQDILNEKHSTIGLYSLYGSLLQAIGNSLQSIAGIITLQEGTQTENMNAVGSWIQAIGAVIQALVQSKSM